METNAINNLKMTKPRKIYLTIIALLLITSLVACGSTPTPVTPTSLPPTSVPPTPVPPTPVPPTSVPATSAPDPAYFPDEPVAVVPAGVPGQPMVEAAINTVIYSGPGRNYVVYGAFLGGVTAKAVGVSTDSQWYAISVPVAPGGNGWVSAAFVLPTNVSGLPVLASPPIPPTVDMVPPQQGDPQATALAQIFVRSGPSNNFPAFGIAQVGRTALVIGKSEDGAWLVVRADPNVVGAGFAWVEKAFTMPSNIDTVPVIATPELPPPVQPAPPPAGAPAATAIDFVNLRSGPGTNYKILGMVAPGTAGEVVGKSQDGLWWQVKVPTSFASTGVAWVSAAWVTTTNTANVPVVTAPPPV